VNFINDELWGDVCSPDQPWCLIPATSRRGARRTGIPRSSTKRRWICSRCRSPLLYGRKPKDGVVAWTWFTIYASRARSPSIGQADFTWHGITGAAVRAPHDRDRIAMIVWCNRHNAHTDVAPGVPDQPRA